MRYPNRILWLVIGVLVFYAFSCSKETKMPVTDPYTPSTTVAPSSQAAGGSQGSSASTGKTSSSGSHTSAPYYDVSVANPDDGTPYTGCCKTENVIIIVMDGPRFSETFGDYTKQYIPNQQKMYTRGAMLGNFRNNGTTNTDSGHDAICTGNYEDLENTGQVLPQYPSIFQQYLKATGKPAEKAWVVASKDKLQILADCQTLGWAGQYMPRTDCGKNGLFSGYRSDDTTYHHAENIISAYHPNLMLINFKDPDVFGHSNQWGQYLTAIKKTDEYIKALYDFIENDEIYKGKTTVIITNDHGRHLTGVADGFMNHGDGCEGCRHIEFLALGPDFKQGAGIDPPYEQIDISATVAKLLHFNMDYGKGKVIDAIFR
ncbi:alkaline phosphatase family protein [Mucilaginibacter panaciglaebae]|uniref:alkaline phosphatase family protein n=1 Tax=Mucilaginibacter panaciglaebae TaxID=502331 RepID=UPI0031EB4BDB